MSAGSPNKVVLKSTTKLSLNDRFSSLRKDAGVPVATIRQNMQQVRQASARNRRLAQQMENRPTVIAALKLKKWSLKQRLGQFSETGGVKARLTLGNRGGSRGRALGTRTLARGVLNRRGLQQRGTRRGGGRGAVFGTNLRGVSPIIRARLGNQNNQTLNTRGNRGMRSNRRGRGFGSPRGSGFVTSRQYSPQFRGNFRGRLGSGRGSSFQRRGTGRGTGGRGGTARGRGRGRGGATQHGATRQELDEQLDEYMSKTRSQLDADLDAYMAEAAN